MKIKRIISTLLAVVMLASAMTLVIGAEEETKEYTYNTSSTSSQMVFNAASKQDETLDKYSYKTGAYKLANGTTGTIASAEDKLATMDYRYGNGRYELYIDAFSGEVAVVDTVSGEMLFTNPWNIGSSKATNNVGSTKDELLSQIVVNYTDVKTNTPGTYYSYTWAANRGQIAVKTIKGGLRVEYAIGREESRSLLPRMIEVSAMEEIFATIEANIEEAIASGKVSEKDAEDERHRFTQFKSYYGDPYRLSDAISEDMKVSVLNQYPVLEKCDIYVLDDGQMGENTVKKLENLMKQYHPEYTFEDLDEAHRYVEYEAENESSPLFKMALEYTLEDTGLVVRLAAGGIRFNESAYRLDSIDILPYIGAGTNPNPGYTFFPDGSGTLFDFKDIAILGTRQLVTGRLYGQDFAYHEISGTYEETLRYPVFGVTETETLTKNILDEEGNVVETQSYEKDRGYVAIVEEGDSLLELASFHAGQTSEYNAIKMSVYPRPTDSYNLADAISVGSNSTWTVVSDRKYTGNYKVRYMMLTDEDVAAEKKMSEFYECSYVGMAKAYRSYLEKNGILTRLTAEDVSEDIPLYIETFGAVRTTKKFLSIPVNVMTPLTSFDDIRTMYEDLEGEGIQNVNFIMTGYTDGGMTNRRMPYKLKWENAVEGDMDFEDLLAYAKEKDFGLFPDFDFVFTSGDYMFDGLSLKKHAVKTIDNRYTSKREYSATKHTFVTNFELAISPAYFEHFYEKFTPKYQKYEPIGISVSTLGSYLNSDFDEDEPYNRADGQEYTVQAFAYLREQFADAEIMTSGGNSYCWKYVDHITDIALDSSRFSVSSAAVPFLGIVLHGYVEIAGTPINMEGNLELAFLKSLENGAALNFILSYQNTAALKEYHTLSQYYSVRYDIWFEDMVSMYTELNALLKDVQTSTIEVHEFLDGVRVPDADELEADAIQAVKDAIAAEAAKKEAETQAEQSKILNAKLAIQNGVVKVKDAMAAGKSGNLAAMIANVTAQKTALDQAITDADAKIKAYSDAQKKHADYKYDPTIGDKSDLVTNKETGTRVMRDKAKTAATEATAALNEQMTKLYTAVNAVLNELDAVKKAYADAKAGAELLEAEQAFEDAYREALLDLLDAEFETQYASLTAVDHAAQAKTAVADAFTAYKALKDATVVLETEVKDDTNKAVAEYDIADISKLMTVTEYQAPETNKNEEGAGANSGAGAVGGDGDTVDSRYVSDPNNIVYEVYENGTAFLLNFNDYRVVVTIKDGKHAGTYTIDAYGYLVLERAA